MKRPVLSENVSTLALAADDFQALVLDWFELHGRKNLPWQQTPTAYHVWLSEIMLQQTQVATVIPYFQRFIQQFPSLQDLAAAELDDVLHYWSGLGYYARARNLHKTARQLIAEQQGVFPNTVAGLSELAGIGRSTAGAIASLALGQPAAILDGNVKRVLCRCFAVSGWPGNTAILKKLWQLSEILSPQQRSGEYNQAMMDLGATVCTRAKPNCASCPLNEHCLALKQDQVAALPTPKKRASLPVKRCYWLVAKKQSEVQLQQRPAVGLWGGLWAFPSFDDYDELLAWCERQGIDLTTAETLLEKRHTFSHYHLDYTAIVYPATEVTGRVAESARTCWYQSASRVKIGLPKPVSQLIEQLTK
ncbi:MAG: A/G-specific adenine glycosylase [Cycloclasticus sp.]